MFYCDNCEKEVTEKEMFFDYDDNAFRHKVCGQAVEYINRLIKQEVTK